MMNSITPPELERVTVCVPDHYGRLLGREICAGKLPAAVASGLEMPTVHLISGPDNPPASGLTIVGQSDPGLAYDVLWPDMQTFRRLPWDPVSGLVIAQERQRDGTIVAQAPRAILQHQAERLAEHGLFSWVTSELEFYVFEDSYPQAFSKAYRGLSPLSHRDCEVSGMLTDVLDLYLRPLCLVMADFGLPAECSQGEGGAGHAKVSFPASAPIPTADCHALVKYAAKAIADQQSRAVTFMAKPDQLQSGSSCRLQLALRDANGSPCTATRADAGGTELSEPAARFLAGLVAHTPELTLLHAPLVNSYRRLQPSGSAPSAASWGYDNPDAMVRIIGGGPSLRMEFRLPGADVNPYLAIAAILAAGIAGLEEDPPEPFTTPPSAAVPLDLTEALRRFEQSKLAIGAFGREVRDHMAGMARHQLRLARNAVTDWELEHGFETA